MRSFLKYATYSVVIRPVSTGCLTKVFRLRMEKAVKIRTKVMERQPPRTVL